MSVDYDEDYYHYSNWEDVRCMYCDYLFGTAPSGSHGLMTCDGCRQERRYWARKRRAAKRRRHIVKLIKQWRADR